MERNKISMQTIITDWGWREDCRPELKLDDNHKSSALYIGNNFVADIDGKDSDELINLLEGYRDIFAQGVKFIQQNDKVEFQEGSEAE